MRTRYWLCSSRISPGWSWKDITPTLQIDTAHTVGKIRSWNCSGGSMKSLPLR